MGGCPVPPPKQPPPPPLHMPLSLTGSHCPMPRPSGPSHTPRPRGCVCVVNPVPVTCPPTCALSQPMNQTSLPPAPPLPLPRLQCPPTLSLSTDPSGHSVPLSQASEQLYHSSSQASVEECVNQISGGTKSSEPDDFSKEYSSDAETLRCGPFPLSFACPVGRSRTAVLCAACPLPQGGGVGCGWDRASHRQGLQACTSVPAWHWSQILAVRFQGRAE